MFVKKRRVSGNKIAGGWTPECLPIGSYYYLRSRVLPKYLGEVKN